MSAPRAATWQYQPYAEPVLVPAVTPTVLSTATVVVAAVAAVAISAQAYADPTPTATFATTPTVSLTTSPQPVVAPPITRVDLPVAPVSPPVSVAVVGASGQTTVATYTLTQYQAVAGVIKTTAAPTLTVWYGSQPDQARGPAVPQPPQQQSLPAPAFPVPPLAWKASWPDMAAGQPPLRDYGVFATGAGQVSAWPVSWRASYPDLVPGRAPLPDYGRFAFVPSVFPPPQPGVWRGVYPDQAPGRSPLSDYGWWTTGAQLTSVAPLAWRGTYPDVAPGRAPLPDYGRFALAWPSAYPVPSLSWKGVWPDRVPGRQPLADWQTLALDPYPFTLTIDQLGWRGRYADWLPAPRLPEFPAWTSGATQGSVAPTAWRPSYPDVAPGRAPLPDYGRFALVSPSPFPVPSLSWKPVFADVVPGLRPLTDWQTLGFYPVPITVPTSQLGWRGAYPDWLPLLRPAEFMAWASGATSSAFPVPSLTWRAVYPDRTFAAQPVIGPQAFALDAFPRTALTPLSWQGRFVDLLAQLGVIAQPSAAVPPTVQFAPWFAAYAADVARAAWTVPGAGSVLPPTVQPVNWFAAYAEAPVRQAVVVSPSFVAPLTVLPPLTWFEAPQAIVFAAARPAWLGVTQPFAPTIPPPILTWQPTYPDRALARETLRTAAQLAWVTGETSSAFPPPPLTWLAKYPDRAPGRQPLADWQTFAWSEWQIVRPPAPSLAWHPAYPDFAQGLPPLPVGAMPFLAFFKPLIFIGPETLRFVNERIWQPMTLAEAVYVASLRGEAARLQPLAMFVLELIRQAYATTEAAVQPRVVDEDTF